MISHVDSDETLSDTNSLTEGINQTKGQNEQVHEGGLNSNSEMIKPERFRWSLIY